MKKIIIILVIALSTPVFSANIIKLDTIKFNPQDSTVVLQKAFASGAKKVIITHQRSPWMVKKTLLLSSNQEIIFEDGAELKAIRGAFKGANDALLIARNCKNLSISGRGILTMNKKDYQNPKEYKRAEWRHTLALFNCENIKIDGLTMQGSGGDGIYINNVKNILINAVTLKNHHRQGISVISAENLLVKNSLIENTNGAAPMAGIDFEPNRANERLINCVVEKCRFINNNGAGVLVALPYLTSRSRPISITIRDCELSGNRDGVLIYNTRQEAVDGKINFVNCRIVSSKTFTFKTVSQTAKGYKVSLKNCLLDNQKAASDGAFELTGGYVSGPLGNVDFDKVQVRDNRQNARAFKFNGWRMYSLQKLTGSITDASGKIISMRDIIKKSRSKTIFSSAKLSSDKNLYPRQKIIRKTDIKSLQMRFNGTFVQYARKGETLKVTAQVFKVGRNNSAVSLEIVSPSGKTVRKRSLQLKKQAEIISLKAKENGIYRFNYKTHANGLSFCSDSPGNGYLVDSPIRAIRTPGRIYFVVPPGAREVAVRISGDSATETVSASLLNPVGKEVMRKEKIGTPELLIHIRKNPNLSEIWSVVFDQVVEDFNFAILGESIPIVADAPDKLFKQQDKI